MFQEILIDFSLASILMVVAYFLRRNVKFLQKCFIPVSVIAGLLGLLLGPEVLGRFCPVYLHWSEYVGSYANPLLAILFVSQFLTLRVNGKMAKKCALVFLISMLTIGLQVGSALPLVRLFHVPDGFALLPFLGFYGAHGLPSLAAGVFQEIGYWDYTEANSVGTTFATLGMLYGVIVGIVLINIASRKKWTANQDAGKLSKEELTGYIERKDRKAVMSAVSTNTAITPLALHVAIIGSIMVLGYQLLFLMQKLSVFKTFAIQIPAIILALVVNVIASKTSLGDILDGDSLQQIGNTALEFLIVTAVATTNLTVVMNYALPIFVMALVGLVLTTIATVLFSKLWIKQYWFENAMAMFGSWTGSTATGLMLLRTADPNMESDGGPNLIAASPFWQLTTQSFFMMVAPYMIVSATGFRNIALICIAFVVASLLVGTMLGRSNKG